MTTFTQHALFLASRWGFGFARPGLLNWLWMLPVFILLAALIRRGKKRGTFGGLLLRLAGASLAALALAGLSREANLERPAAVIAAVDVSDSMGEEGRRWAREECRKWLERAGTESRAGALLFARRCRRRTLPEAGNDSGREETDGTDIATAILRASLSFPAGAPKHLLLFSDGNETSGDALGAARAAGEGGIRIHCFPLPGGNGPRAQLKKIDLPAEVNASDTFSVRVLTENPGQRALPAGLIVRVGGEILRRTAVELPPGTSEHSFECRREKAGLTEVTASLSFPESAEETKESVISAEIAVTEPPKLLFVAGSPRAGAFLTRALKASGMTVAETTPQLLPGDVNGLIPYRGIVLSNLPAEALSEGQMKALKRFVGDLGRGLVVAGGWRGFSAGDYAGTTLEEILPVKSEPRPRERKEASRFSVIAVIDRSGSMKSESKIRNAKRAAEELIDVLDERDQAGLITFTSEHEVVFPLQPLRRAKKWEFIDRIRRIRARGGTFMLNALREALGQLSSAASRKKHIIVITDGFCAGTFPINNPSGPFHPAAAPLKNLSFASTGGRNIIPSPPFNKLRELAEGARDGYRRFFRECLESRVSVTAIGVGKRMHRPFLEQLARQTGGSFYELKSSAQLVTTVLRDTQRIIADTPNLEEEIIPRFGENSDILKGISEQKFPRLLGYTVTRPREKAEVLLQVEREGTSDPILAVWQFGLGRAAAFTSDIEARWSAELVRWPFFRKFWSQLVRWSTRAEAGEPYRVRAGRENGKNFLALETFRPADDDSNFQLVLGKGENGSGTRLPLHQLAPRLWRCEIGTLPEAGSPVTVERLEKGELAGLKETFLFSPPLAREEKKEESRRGSNLKLLGEIARSTGGLVDPATDELDFPPEVIPRKMDLTPYLIPLIFACLLADIALRKLGER